MVNEVGSDDADFMMSDGSEDSGELIGGSRNVDFVANPSFWATKGLWVRERWRSTEPSSLGDCRSHLAV